MRPKSIIQKFTTAGEVTTSMGKMPKQYHVYDSTALLIFGSIKYEAVYYHLNGSSSHAYYPIKYRNQRAPMIVWMSDFYDSNHGDHNELNFTTYIGKNNLAIEYADINIDQTPFSFFNTITDASTVTSTPCAVYNNCPKVVSYNTEYLNLPVKLAKGDGLTMDGDNSKFEWIDNETNKNIISGSVEKTASFQDIYDLYKAIGFKSLLQTMAAPYQYTNVMNLDGKLADVYLQAPKQNTAIFSWNEETMDVRIEHETIKEFEFEPLICSHYTNMQFVYQPAEQDRM